MMGHPIRNRVAEEMVAKDRRVIAAVFSIIFVTMAAFVYYCNKSSAVINLMKLLPGRRYPRK